VSKNSHTEALLVLKLARKALREKNRTEAYRQAGRAARLDPNLEEPWLILAAVAAPRASVDYIRKALEINPASQNARKAMHWAVQRLRASEQDQGGSQNPSGTLADTNPTHIRAAPAGAMAPIQQLRKLSAVKPQPVIAPVKKSASGQSWLITILAMLVIASVTAYGWLFYPNLRIALADNHYSARAAGVMPKPSITPTSTATPTPTSTPTPTPTFTPTNTPLPTSTPTSTPKPVVYSGVQIPEEVADGERWIDIDLSDQMVYAYEGDQLANSFLVSTGTWQHPTVTGLFRIYVKYRYTDMAGPGYYLPDVPYTMYFYKGYGLHGTYWHDNFGTPMSHGCVNLRTEEAGWLFDWASVDTVVNVHD
jgi:hypothetical protein